jgi:methionyl-tRNA formyltransferase
MKIKTVFLGSNWEALATLKTLNEDERFDLVCLITQPDKPVGRKKIIQPTEIKQYALDNGIEVFHTLNNKDRYKEAFERYNPELVVCKSYGEIIPKFFLEQPKYKAINVHFSLLPEYRGAVPIQKAIMDGKKETGITIVQMVRKLDAGPILESYKISIEESDDNQTLREKLVQKSTEVLPDILEKWVQNEIEAVPQDDSIATFCQQSDISKENAEINWNMNPEEISNRIRAFIPWPVAWTMFEGKRLKVFKAKVVECSTPLEKGMFGSFEKKLVVGSTNSKKVIQLIDVQVEGRQRMSGEDFIRGREL